MRKDLLSKLLFVFSFLFLISLYKSFVSVSFSQGWFQFEYLEMWVGSVIGLLLLYVDYYIFAYFLRPDNQISVRVKELVENKKYVKSLDYALRQQFDRADLVFHNAKFQLVFLVFAFFVVTSSNSLLGLGIVFGGLFHLLVDMLNDKSKHGSLDGWFSGLPFKVEGTNQTLYLTILVIVIFVMGMFL